MIIPRRSSLLKISGLILTFAFFILFKGFTQEISQFIHPGLLNNSQELEYISSNIKEGKDPWKLGFQNLLNKKDFYLTYQPHIHELVIANRGRKDPDSSRDDMTKDGEAVYANALLWYFTHDEVHALKAIEIIDCWSLHFKTIHGDDSTLAISYSWPHFLWGAEIIRETFPKWHAESQTRFMHLIKNLIYPVGSVFRHYNNWWSWSVCLQITIGVYTNDTQIFNLGITNYQNQLKYYIHEKGYCFEICRDLWHAQMGLIPMVISSEIAWKQGIDLFSKSDYKLYKALEQIIPYIFGNTQNWPCETAPSQTLKFWNGYEMAYNHFHNRCGLPCPNMQRVIENNRPEGYDRIGFGTLTHSESNDFLIKY